VAAVILRLIHCKHCLCHTRRTSFNPQSMRLHAAVRYSERRWARVSGQGIAESSTCAAVNSSSICQVSISYRPTIPRTSSLKVPNELSMFVESILIFTSVCIQVCCMTTVNNQPTNRVTAASLASVGGAVIVTDSRDRTRRSLCV
jgi:hypothetical protein